MLETVPGGVILGCGIAAATVWHYVGERGRWRHGTAFAGIFASGGGAFTLTFTLGKPGIWVGDLRRLHRHGIGARLVHLGLAGADLGAPPAEAEHRLKPAEG